MNDMHYLPFITGCILAVLMPTENHAQTLTKADATIKALYQQLPAQLHGAKRLEIISVFFIGKPYLLGPLGEGKTGRYDQSPLYRVDSFDCQTYVSTVLGLTLSSDLAQFKRRIINIRYHHSQPTYLERNHFVSLDWNPYNVHKGYIRELTPLIKDQFQRPLYQLAHTTIDKGNWLQHKPLSVIKLIHSELAAKRLAELKRHSSQFTPQPTNLAYIPLTKLFVNQQTANEYVFKQIPSGAIIEIVRPNWQLKGKIGTNLNVSHMGFAIRKANGLYFREASSLEKKVIDTPLIPYLQSYLNSPTVKGISIFVPNYGNH